MRPSEIPADDEDNPWRWIETAIVGQPSETIVGDKWGLVYVAGPSFLNDDGQWWLIEPPLKLPLRPVAWRYAMVEQP